jgi:hypothetical protein
MNIKFLAIDPRPQSKDEQVAMLEEMKNNYWVIFGFEATLPWLDALCDYNFDPQHGGNLNLASIEEVFEFLPKFYGGHNGVGAVLVTVRPDLDSIGGMALYLKESRVGCEKFKEFPPERIQKVAAADKFACGPWCPRPLFEGNDAPDLAPIARFVSDFTVPLEDRVEGMLKWLEDATEPDPKYQKSYLAEREEIKNALADGETTLEVIDGVAIVHSKLRAATSIGYSKAPVVVAINPQFSIGGGEPHRKITVCQYEGKYVDLKGVFATLGEGWGGSPTIGGSPQGVDCQTSVGEILAAINTHRKPNV